MSKYVKNWQSSGRGDVKRWEGCEKRKERRREVVQVLTTGKECIMMEMKRSR